MGRKGKGKKGRTQRHNVVGRQVQEPDELRRAPHTFVVARGRTGRYVNQLVLNFRQVMEPFTASSLQVKKPTVKHLASVAGLLGVTHCCVFSHTQLATYLKIGRFPRGPTLTFKVEQYTLARDVLSSLRRRVTYAHQFTHAPLLILNNFSGGDRTPAHVQLMATQLQNMFPTINVHKVKLRHLRRAVLFSYDAASETVLFRHYTVKLVPSGVNRAVRKLITGSRLPNLARLDSMADFVARAGCASDSELEEDPLLAGHNTVQLAQPAGSRGNNTAHAQSAVRLVELGPRITLSLVKAETGLMDGDVLYHRFHQKTDEQVEALKQQRLARQRDKLARKQQQEANVKRKELLKEEMRQKSMAGQQSEQAAADDASVGSTDDAVGSTDTATRAASRSAVDDTPVSAASTADDESVDGGHVSAGKRKRSSRVSFAGAVAKRASGPVAGTRPRRRPVMGCKIVKRAAAA